MALTSRWACKQGGFHSACRLLASSRLAYIPPPCAGAGHICVNGGSQSMVDGSCLAVWNLGHLCVGRHEGVPCSDLIFPIIRARSVQGSETPSQYLVCWLRCSDSQVLGKPGLADHLPCFSIRCHSVLLGDSRDSLRGRHNCEIGNRGCI